MSFLSLDSISHYYFSPTDYTKALENISFKMDEGEFISIIGPSGCGKSTILSIIARILTQTEGNIYIKEQNIMQSSVRIGYMLQQDYLFPWKTITDNVLIGPKINQSITSDTMDNVKQLLDDVGLPETETKYPSELSGGMRQRVALVRTLITDPDILLFDEPFSALDYVTKLKLENTVAKLVQQYRKTAILVTHDLAEAISMSDRIILMDANPGRIQKVFNVPEEIRDIEPFYVRRHPAYQDLFDYIWQYVSGDMTSERNNQHEGND